MNDCDRILIENRGRTRILTLNEPERMNPVGSETRQRLLALLNEAEADRTVRAIVLTGAGGNFSAGADVRQMKTDDGPDPARSKRRLKVLQDVVRAIVGNAKPVIAAVDGVAFGAGLAIAAASDHVVVGDGARMGAAFGRIGLAPDCGLLWSLPQRIGLARTKDMIFTGKPLSAQEAIETGLADLLVPAGRALDRAVEKAETYLATAPLSIAATKAALSEMPAGLETALSIEAHQQPLLSMTADHNAARQAFLEKRNPEFEGR